MPAENNLITTDEMKRVREIDFTRRFAHTSLAKLIEVLGVTRKIPMQEGTTMYVYDTVGQLANDGTVAEGEIIPLSQYERTKTAIGEIILKKWRKGVSAEAIKKSGYNEAVIETDNKLLRDVQRSIRTAFFTLVNGTITGESTTGGADLQDVLAHNWGQLQVLFEDDAAEMVSFVNPLDVADYLGAANITVQTAFGLNYVEDFLGMGTVIMSSQITRNTVISTAKENLVLYYLTMNGDLAQAFDLTSDELGYIGINSGYQNKDRAQIESLVMSGIQLFVEYAAGVVKGTIGSYVRLDKSEATVTVEGTTTLTAETYPSGETVTWASSDSTVATVSNGTVTGVKAGTATITASITVDGKTYTDSCTVTVSAGA